MHPVRVKGMENNDLKIITSFCTSLNLAKVSADRPLCKILDKEHRAAANTCQCWDMCKKKERERENEREGAWEISFISSWHLQRQWESLYFGVN